MSKQLNMLKNKSLVTRDSESESDYEYVSEEDPEDDFGLLLGKLSLGPRKKLLVMSLGGVLLHRAFKRDKAGIPKHRRPDLLYGNHLVYSRPHSEDFMKFCLERYEVGIWASAIERNVDACLDIATGELRSKLLFIWDQEYCTDSGYMALEKKTKPILLKELRKIWENTQFGRRFSSSNTLLIDDSPYKAILNPASTGIFPASYDPDNDDDTELGPGGELRKYLDGLVDAADVASYVKEHPFGQPAISPTHPQWKFYSKIINLFPQ